MKILLHSRPLNGSHVYLKTDVCSTLDLVSFSPTATTTLCSRPFSRRLVRVSVAGKLEMISYDFRQRTVYTVDWSPVDCSARVDQQPLTHKRSHFMMDENFILAFG